jgi:hypothetical protein
MRSPWHLVNRRTVEWGALGALVTGVAATLYFLNAAPIETVRFPEITRAMKETPWVHASVYGYGLSIPAFREFWIGFDSKVYAGRMPDGKVSFCNLEELHMTEYDPNGRTVARFRVEEQESLSHMLAPLLSLENMQQALTDCGGKTAARMGHFRGREVRVQETSFSTHGPRITRYVMTLYIDPQSKLLQAVQVVARDAAGAIVTAGQIAFDYPQNGPRDIYDLGVPPEARVVSHMPADDWRTVRQWYRRARAEAMKEYFDGIQAIDCADGTHYLDDIRAGSGYWPVKAVLQKGPC